MWYNVDFHKLALNFQVIALRKPKFMAWIYSFIKPITTFHYNWKIFRKENLYKIEHTWQVCYMRGALNDEFDQELRRIYIEDNELYQTTYVHTEPEEQELWLNVEAETELDETIWIYTEAETEETGVDFIVFVPESIAATQTHELRATIDFYKLGGMKYIIETIAG